MARRYTCTNKVDAHVRHEIDEVDAEEEEHAEEIRKMDKEFAEFFEHTHNHVRPEYPLGLLGDGLDDIIDDGDEIRWAFPD